MTLLQTEVGVSVSYATAWRRRNIARNEVIGDPEESFLLLPSYLYMLEQANPGTKMKLCLDGEERCKYFFVALGPCMEGFEGMRKVIIVDATFLKAGYNGVLVIATAQDPNHHHYPLAFGVIDGEKDASWNWFFERLKTIFPDNSELVFVTDRNQSLVKAVGEVYPRAQHGFCIYHMSQNVKSHVYYVDKEEAAKKFRECARVYTEAEFLQKYDEFKRRYPTTVTYLEKWQEGGTETINSVKYWARCYFPGEMYNIDTNSETQQQQRHRKEAAFGQVTEKLVPYVENILHSRCLVAKKLVVVELNSFEFIYKVTGKDGNAYVVHLLQKNCECKHFEIDKYPCVHALAAAMKCNEQKDGSRYFHYHDQRSRYYWTDQWKLAYVRTIYPVPTRYQWLIPAETCGFVCKPPDFPKRKKGRKRDKRFTSTGEHRRGNKREPGQNLQGLGYIVVKIVVTDGSSQTRYFQCENFKNDGLHVRKVWADAVGEEIDRIKKDVAASGEKI
ncbi:uncharacterized protein LOC112088071 [Eutrema salsugineum]|uniref:uncharacterized protein LOC112088071 n=1 Tax=Eutrema salsugineum TaxID=72664 RepID=UPI000CED567E|nr:uncharacterized protein LOC112088071 [Eutrema salsugineum]